MGSPREGPERHTTEAEGSDDPVIPDRPAARVPTATGDDLAARAEEIQLVSRGGEGSDAKVVELLRSGAYPPLMLERLARHAGASGHVLDLLSPEVPPEALEVAVRAFGAGGEARLGKAASALAGHYEEVFRRIRPVMDPRDPGVFFRLAARAGEVRLLASVGRSRETSAGIRAAAIAALAWANPDEGVPIAGEVLADATTSPALRRELIREVFPPARWPGRKDTARRILETVAAGDPNPWIRRDAESRLRWLR